MFSPRIRIKQLAALCHRLAISTKAGIKDRKFWESESERGSGTQRRISKQISDDISSGHTVADAVMNTGDYFPMLFRQMVLVGEQTGKDIATFTRLSDHYDRTLRIQREFIARIRWPLFQAGSSVFVVGLLIWIMGLIPAAGGQRTDILGFGLVGNKGLFIYMNFLVMIGIAILLFLEMSRRGFLWTRRLQRTATRIPGLGGSLKTLALARFTWSFQLLLSSGMDIRKSVPLALNASGSDYFGQHAPEIVMRIQQGQSLTQAVAATGVFPRELLDSISVGEESGSLVEVLERLSEDYQDRAARAISALAQFASYVVWLFVAAIIILLIARIFSFYYNTINSAVQGF